MGHNGRSLKIRRERYCLSATDAWRGAAVGDGPQHIAGEIVPLSALRLWETKLVGFL